MKKFFSLSLSHLFAAIILIGITGCSPMHESNEDCPNGLFVRFTFDYNIHRADMFKDHVGCVTLYIYDQQGHKVAERSVSNTDSDQPLSRYGYAKHFTPAELPAGKYRLVAIGMQRDWEEAAACEGARYRRPTSESHTHSDHLSITLDHSDTPDPESGHHKVEHLKQPLDTLWHTVKVMNSGPLDGVIVPDIPRTTYPVSVYPLEEQYVEVADSRATYATVSLIRDTKHIGITLRQLDHPTDTYADDFEVTITDSNATVGHDNEVSSCHKLIYSPYNQWTSRFNGEDTEIESGDIKPRAADSGDSDNVIERAAHYNIMTNRLMHSSKDPEKNARLQIRHKATGRICADINLTSALQQGRFAYEQYAYSAQDYLDREWDYNLQFFLLDGEWRYVDIVINTLSWSRRIQTQQL